MRMNEYFTAPSYDTWERYGEPFEEKGKMYTKIRTKCWKCGGSGYYAWFGTCFKCNGDGYEGKKVRLYTESERASLEKAATKRAEAAETKRINKLANLKQTFSKENGFDSETGITYMAIGNTYAVKDELKALGYKYSNLLNWHGPKAVEIEGIDFVAVEFDKVYVRCTDYYDELETAHDYIESLKYADVESSSLHLGEVGEKVCDLDVTVTSVKELDGYYGLTYIYSFEDTDGNKITWFSSRDKELEVDDKIVLEGTIKKLDSYKGENITVLTRCKVNPLPSLDWDSDESEAFMMAIDEFY